MSPDRWSRVAALFQAAQEKPDAERDGFLEQACDGDASLISEVRLLLEVDEEDDEFLEEPVLAAMRQERPEDVADRRISHYTLINRLGEGGMGVVYKAWDRSLDRLVAIKFVSPRLDSRADGAVRFIQEAKTVSALDHPNLCTIYEIDSAEDGRMFIAMAFYDGETLRQKIRRGALPVDEAVDTAIQVGQGLAKAHSIDIVHRDVKPANVIVTADGYVKILDFGVAKLGAGMGLTRSGMTVGTASYMAPEQAEGKPIDTRADIWSLGVLLYEMLSGRVPFEGSSDLTMMFSIVNSEPRPLDLGTSEAAVSLQAIVARALEKEPADRYSSMEEMIADLKAVGEGGADKPRRVRAATLRRAPSIAVLPLLNLSSGLSPSLSPGEDNEAFCDGLTEELISALSRLEGLRVVSRTTMSQYKGKAQDIREIGKQLEVATVLEGSVRVSGDKMRVSAHLVNVADGATLWSERYDRTLDDVFALQDEISQTVVQALEIRLKGEVDKPRVQPGTKNLEAYRLYLKGRHHLKNWSPQRLDRAADLFAQAVLLDGAYARAYTGLADVWLVRGFWGLDDPAACWPRAREAAEKAAILNPQLGEARASLGAVRVVESGDWEAADKEFQQALELSPEESTTHSWRAGFFLAPLGRKEECLEADRKAIELDPLSPRFYAAAAWSHVIFGQTDEALRMALNAMELSATFFETYWALGAAHLDKGEVEEALRALETAQALAPGQSFTTALLARAHARAGATEKARELAEKLRATAKQRYVAPTQLAWAALACGDVDLAFAHLEEACERRDPMALFLGVGRLFGEIRKDKRYPALLEKAGLSRLQREGA